MAVELPSAGDKSRSVVPRPSLEAGALYARVFDIELLFYNMGGIEELVRDSISLFFEYYPGYVEKIRKSIAAADSEKLRHHSHSLKGTALNAGAMALAGVLLDLETLGRGGSTDGSEELFAIALEEIERYRAEVKKLKYI